MKIANACFVSAAIIAITASVEAVVLASWTFEISAPTTAGPHSPEVGSGSATGFHANASTYANPLGNGSAESFSSNSWTVGDYYQFLTSSEGFEGISITFDQTGSATGPRDFQVQYSTDGVTFANLTGGGYVVTAATWNSGTAMVSNQYSFDLSPITALDNDSSIFIRLTASSSDSIGGGTVGGTGASRVDNVTISAISAIPEPAAAMLGALGCIGFLRRRR
jgi:hypothetical protein